MRLFAISFVAALFLLLPFFIPLDAFADGQLSGRVFMNYQGRQIPLKGVFINKIVDCNKLDNKNLCQNISCLSSSFCPSIPQPYYTKDDGKYVIDKDDHLGTIVKNNQPAVCSDGGFEIACGIDCGKGNHEFSAYFPSNYNINNFPAGIDLRKGHFKATTPASDNIVILKDPSRNEYYHLTETNNNSNNPDLNFEWIPDPLPIAGVVVNSQTNQGLAGVVIDVFNDRGLKLSATTDNSGKFSVLGTELFTNSNRYAVRISSVPTDFKLETKAVTTTNWSYNVALGHDQLPTDPSYEQQQTGANDCAGPDFDPSINPHQTGRCNFKIAQLPPSPTATITSTITSPLNGSPTSAISSTISTTITTSITTSATSTVSPTTNPSCDLIPTSGSGITAIKIDNRSIDISTFSSIKITLSSSSLTVPISVNYSNGACRVLTLRLNYAILSTTTITPTPTINPTLCTPTTGRLDGCSCTSNPQCQSGLCDLIQGGICQTPARIKTGGGDVQSNDQIKGPGR